MLPSWMAQVWLAGVALALVWAGRGEASDAEHLRRPASWPAAAGSLALTFVAIFAPDGRVAYVALAIASAFVALAARRIAPTAALYLGAGVLLQLASAAALHASNVTVLFTTSTLAIALRCGIFPLHSGAAALVDRRSPVQLVQLASLPTLVFLHLRFADHGAVAHDVAPLLVAIGGASCLMFALISLVERDLQRLYVASTLMHGGMLFAAVGAAGRGHFAAALLVGITMVIALAGFGVMVAALESRVGSGPVVDFVGRARAFPRLAAAMAFFGGAAVGLPGTAGFVADDLLLHALWEESVWTAVVVIVASALLAVATLGTFSRVMLGPPRRHLAPDLLGIERGVVIVFMLLLLTLGFAPKLLVSPVNALLQ